MWLILRDAQSGSSPFRIQVRPREADPIPDSDDQSIIDSGRYHLLSILDDSGSAIGEGGLGSLSQVLAAFQVAEVDALEWTEQPLATVDVNATDTGTFTIDLLEL
ncbi:hypothetical protein GCM10009747_07350 [Agromyces humatus]|uniref:Uncharacterized protein n=1 Tax=Agromyces humatus TaxID=279573 RepID=A0ABN2KBA9_9MICO